MAKKEEHTIWYVILGIAAIFVIIGLTLFLSGRTGGVAIPTYNPGPICWPSGEQACISSVACEGGNGGILVGEQASHYQCICDEHLLRDTIGQFGSFPKASNGMKYNPDHIKSISKCRTY